MDVFSIFMVATQVFALAVEEQHATAMVLQLDSASFSRREEATDWLMRHPRAQTALEQAAKSARPEAARRIGSILEHYDRLPEIHARAAFEAGRADEFVHLMYRWPAGKREREAWLQMHAFASKLNALHTQKGGVDLGWAPFNESEGLPKVITCERFEQPERFFEKEFVFLRARNVFLGGGAPCEVIAVESVHLTKIHMLSAVFACGPVTARTAARAIIVSASDVAVDDAFECLIVAKGKVTVNKGARDCRIIAGDRIIGKDRLQGCITSENDATPLGFVRWADAPKEKGAPKAKEKGDPKQ